MAWVGLTTWGTFVILAWVNWVEIWSQECCKETGGGVRKCRLGGWSGFYKDVALGRGRRISWRRSEVMAGCPVVVVAGERFYSKVANCCKGNILVCWRRLASDTEGLLQFSHCSKREGRKSRSDTNSWWIKWLEYNPRVYFLNKVQDSHSWCIRFITLNLLQVFSI